MRFISTVAVLATAALAAPNPEPWCFRVGMPCWKVKRTTDAFVSAVQSSGGIAARGEPVPKFDGIPNDIAVNALKGLNDLASLIVYSSNDPNILNNLGPSEIKPSDNKPADNKAQGVEQGKSDNEKRDIEVQEDKRWCFRVGMPCWKAKRAAEAVINATVEDPEVEESELNKREPWCASLKHTCNWLIPPDQFGEKRSVEEEKVQEDKRWCFRVGMPCWKAKRDLQSIQEAARTVLASLE